MSRSDNPTTITDESATPPEFGTNGSIEGEPTASLKDAILSEDQALVQSGLISEEGGERGRSYIEEASSEEIEKPRRFHSKILSGEKPKVRG